MSVRPALALRVLAADDTAAIVELCGSAYGRLPMAAPMIADDLARPATGSGAGRSIGAFDAMSGRLVAAARAIDVAGAWHVVDVATHPDRRREGLASLVLGELLESLHEADTGGWTLEVRASNVGAIALYCSHGFRELGRRSRYYDAPVEDAVVMWRAPSAIVRAGGGDSWEPQL